MYDNYDQMTPLHRASSNDHTEIVQLLLQFNEDPNCVLHIVIILLHIINSVSYFIMWLVI